MAEERGSQPKQERSQLLMQVRQVWPGLLLACVVGIAGFGVKLWMNSVYADPLLVAMVLGICTRWLTGNNGKLRPGLLFSYRFFIPIGIVFYGAVKLNFVKFMQVEKSYIALIMLIILVYFLIILGLGRFLKQRKQVTFLTATGSAICGASAIAITSPAVDAESEDISVSLISVFFASAFGLFILLPFLCGLMHLPEQVYAFLAGATLQFTGFVKAAAGDLPKELYSLAVSIKAVRYLGLFLAIPLFSSLARHRFSVPWFLWVFLVAGVVFSFVPGMAQRWSPVCKPIQVLSWSIAMGAIGLNADVNALLTDNGLKALSIAFCGFLAAVTVFLAGIALIQ